MKSDKLPLGTACPDPNAPRAALPVLLALIALGTSAALADVVIVESRSGGQNVGWYSDASSSGGTTAANWAISSAKSSAPGTTGGIGSRYNPTSNTPDTNGFTAGPSFTVTPTLAVAGGQYLVEITYPNGNNSPSIVVGTTQTGCSGLPATTTAFQGAANNTWKLVGTMTLDSGVTQPTIRFQYSSGFLAATGGRWYGDAVRFTLVDPCLGVSPQIASVTGPLATGQTYVNVPGVDADATNLTVYANGNPIGSLTSGIVAGVNVVPTSALVKNEQITATQTKSNCVSTRPLTGPPVGGGINPRIRVSLSLAKNPALTGPIGATGASSANLYFLRATGPSGGFATAPIGGYVVYPGTCWQTLTFNNDTDTAYHWTGSGTLPNPDAFASLESIAFCIDDTDSGPYEVYIDSIRNGDTLIEGFEGYTNDTYGVLFLRPGASTAPADLLSQPDICQVSTNNADTGTNSLRASWQFKNTATASWVRLYAAGLGNQYPQIDLRRPVSVRLLVLPAGQTNGMPFNGTVSGITNASPAWTTGTNTLGISVTGGGSYTYQWTWSGGALAEPTTNPSYTLENLSSANNGLYSVTVSDGSCSLTRSANLIVKDPIPTITNQPTHGVVTQGSTAAAMTVGATGHVPAGYPLTYQWRSNGVDIPDQTAATLWITNAQLADVGPYDVVVGNGYGSVTSVVAFLSVVPPGVVPGNGTGLRGDYYNLPSFAGIAPANPFIGAPALSRVDSTVNFDWGTGTPGSPVQADYFSTRWYGQIQPLGTDTYTIYTTTDDGVRLWIGGQLLIDKWLAQAPTEWTNTIALTSTNKQDIVMEYFERAGGAVARLSWSTASGSIAKQIVPMTQLYPAASLPQPALSFSVNNGTNLVFNWGPGTYSLAWATNVTGPYTNIIPAVTSPYTVIIGSEPTRFFRLLIQ